MLDSDEFAAEGPHRDPESKEVLVNSLYRRLKTAVAQRVLAAFPHGAPPRTQFQVMWNEMVAYAVSAPTAFAFIELHNHASYLDAESLAIDRNIKEFASAMIKRAQAEGVMKPVPAHVLMELVFGAFVGMMRAHWEGRIDLSDEVSRGAEQACWDDVEVPPRAQVFQRKHARLRHERDVGDLQRKTNLL